jgi:hypothetical protein
MYTEAACLIAGCGHYATGSIMANGYWQASQLRAVALLHGCKELIHVDM